LIGEPSEDISKWLQRLEADPDSARAVYQKLQPLLEETTQTGMRCLGSLVRNSSILFWETDSRFRYTWLSPTLEEKYGWKPEEVIGKSLADFVQGDDLDEWLQLTHKKPRQFRGFSLKTQAKNGASVYLLSDGVPYYDQQGRFAGMRGFSTDITRQVLI